MNRVAVGQRLTGRSAPQLPRGFRSPARRIDIVVLAVLAYLPALASSPGRMPADTKLYLYTDPGGLLGRAASTFEPDQFAGWVPHQQITYLWPSGPWFWLFDALSVPDWIAHRLWIGTLMFAAGMGLRRCAHLLGHIGGAALAGAVVYQLSPYLLAYVSRTSLLLLPWAGLGWIVAATIRATRFDRDATRATRWREPALIALIVATIGSTNATALAMIIPAPAIWLALAAIQRDVPVRRLAAIVVRVTAACSAVSLWWIAMLIVQSRSGAPVLLYSETLEDVSRNSTGPEVLRGLGYWLFYGRDALTATTTSSLGYLTRTSGILISFVLPVVGLIGLGFGRSEHRRFASLLALAGIVLAVGVHPIDRPSPLLRILTGDSETGLALALRSSTRAVPVMVLGLALGTAALIERLPRRSPPTLLPASGRAPRSSAALSGVLTVRRLAAGAVVVTAVLNMPSVWQGRLVDPAIDRDSDLPAAWVEAASRLDSQDDGTRVLQLPGAEFGAFDWGYTVDQPLVSAIERDVVTRDLLPLGSAPAMDLLYAFDDQIQQGTLEPAAIAPIARLLGAGTIWAANDVDAVRFRTPPAGSVAALLDAAPGLAGADLFGVPTVPTVSLDPFGRSVVDADSVGFGPTENAPVALFDIEGVVPIIRVKTDEVIVSGSGSGVVDAAAAGLIDGSELIRYGPAIENIAPSDRVIVTDSNRDRGHHWRSSQDVTGHTEPGGPGADVLNASAADQRLDPLGTGDDSDTQTVALQRGPITAIASGYGEPFAYRPEDRAVMAIDGSLTTAWTVGDHGDPVGAVLRLNVEQPVDLLLIHQVPPPPGGRQIMAITIEAGGAAQPVQLLASSIDGSGQAVPLDVPSAGVIDITIDSVTLGDAGRAASQAGVGFVEVATGLGSTTEFIRPPIETLQRLADQHGPLDVVLTRERVAATSFWRTDPEPVLRRLLPLTTEESFDVAVTVRLDQRATDQQLAEVMGDEGAIADRRLPGVRHRGAAAVDGDPATAWLTPIDDVVGATLTVTNASGPVAALEILQPSGPWSTISEIVVAGARGNAALSVPPPDDAGRSTVPLPAGLVSAGEPFSLTISAARVATVIERRYGDTITLPAGIAELTATAGIDASVADGRRTVGHLCDATLLTVDDEPLDVSFTATADELLAGDPVVATPCDGALALLPGEHTIVEQPSGTPFTVDRVVLSSGVRSRGEPAPSEQVQAEVIRLTGSSARQQAVDVDCPAGCWLVFGMGHNDAWTASGPTGSLGSPSVVDGGFNGWWIAPTDGPISLTINWSGQRLVTIGLAVSAMAALLCAAALVLAVRQRGSGIASRPKETMVADSGSASLAPSRSASHSSSLSAREFLRMSLGALGFAAGVALTVAPTWGLVVFVLSSAELSARRWWRPVPVLAAGGAVAALFVAASVAVIERLDAPPPNAGWSASFDHLSALAITAVALVSASALLSGIPRRCARSDPQDVVAEPGTNS